MPCMFVYRATEFSGGGAWVGAASCWESVVVGGWGEVEGWVENYSEEDQTGKVT